MVSNDSYHEYKEERMNLSKNKLDTFFLSAFLVYITVYNSAFKQIFTSNIWQYITYAMYTVLYGIFIVQQIGKTQTVKQWLYVFILSLFMFFYLFRGNLNVGSIFLLGLYTINLMSIRSVLKVYLFSFLISLLVIGSLCVLKILPIHDSLYGMLVLGFRNPNSTGFYVTCILLLHWTLNWERFSVINWLEFPIVGILLLRLEDFTALILVVIMLLVKLTYPFFERLFKFKFVYYSIVLLPIIFLGICLWIGINYNNYNFMMKLDDVFTSRPSIWNYYLTNYKMNLFGNRLPDVVLYGVNRTIGHGAFDGEFIYFPIINGLIAFIGLMGLLIFSLRKLLRSKQYTVLILFIIYIISAVSENQLFIPFQCPVAVLMILICYPGFRFERNQDEIEKDNYNSDRPNGRSRWGRDRSYQVY